MKETIWRGDFWEPVYGEEDVQTPPVEGGTSEDGDGGTSEDGEEGEGQGQGEGDAKFTQADLDKAIQKRLGRHKDETAKLAEKLEALQKSTNLSSEEKENLTKQLENLQSTLISKEELAKQEKQRLQSELTTKLDEANKQIDAWKNRYTEETIQRSLTDASITAEAINPSQMVRLLKADTQLVEDLEGEGAFVVKTKLLTKNAEGEAVTLTLTPGEVMEHMKNTPAEYGNLFQGISTGGMGSGNSGMPTTAEALKNTEAYLKYRREGGSLENV